ncbi:MAG TPA: crotonase/enoyl-CoA hydratase family protein [Arenimonas sp.]|uniref:crotonase/enoyl-CoA hydratase family protein n=1 Tax=Arenimonas sp. TaxID=1872635 RepID=UPI002D7E6006|nr:crotonase/enoyl-CoA hydratase family protein [Arenimonas sp.]HEU0152531.1 crotonase/enoyl-CoA hydratase family protein [Arenimonas sp.]
MSMSIVESINRDASFSLIDHKSEAESGIEWCFMHQNPRPGYRPCFSEPLLVELRECQRQIAARMANEPSPGGEIRHLVLASKADVFNLGGDLELFSRLIRGGDRARLLAYAQLCVSVAFHFARLADDRVHSVAVVQGDALGGGFEAALCCHTIIAEEGTGMGFPEVLFDLFPGMGAYTFLSRRVTPAQAERMMLDGNIYSSEELYRMGVVDLLVPRGEGLQAARDLVRRRRRMGNALRSLNTVRATCNPVSLDELMSVTATWVDAAMRLSERGLLNMERLVRAQQRRVGEAPSLRQVV